MSLIQRLKGFKSLQNRKVSYEVFYNEHNKTFCINELHQEHLVVERGHNEVRFVLKFSPGPFLVDVEWQCFWLLGNRNSAHLTV